MTEPVADPRRTPAAETAPTVGGASAERAGPASLEALVAAAGPLLAGYLRASSAVHCLAADRAGAIRTCNPAMAALLRMPLVELIGAPVWRWLTGASGTLLRRELESGLATAEPLWLDFVDAARVPRSLECHLSAAADGFVLVGELPTGMASIDDQVERLTRENRRQGRALERALNDLERRVATRTADLAGVNDLLRRELMARQRIEEELRRSNVELERFAYVASHDLQEPLRMVVSYVQLLQRRYRGKLDQDADEFIEFAVDGAKRMQRLIDDLLVYSRIGRNTSFMKVDLEQVLDAVLADLRVTLQESGAVVTRDPLPTVLADRREMGQLLQNLVSNAIKFRGQAAPRVHVGCRREGNGWLLWVQDNGLGIGSEYQERIFVIFQRLHGREDYPGTGIGLAIARKIVDRHGGRIWVESEPGRGSTFYFVLPDRSADPAPDPADLEP